MSSRLYAAGTDEKKIAAASAYAYNLGVAFQIKDDILDVTASTDELGKPAGSDAQNNKTTYVTLRGVENAQNDVEKLTESAVARLDEFENTEFLKTLSYYLVNRNN